MVSLRPLREALILAAEGIHSLLRTRSAWTPLNQWSVEAWRSESGPITCNNKDRKGNFFIIYQLDGVGWGSGVGTTFNRTRITLVSFHA